MSANVVWQRLLSFFPEFVKGNSGAAPAVDWTKGSVQSMTLNAATVTPTFVAPPGGCNLALVITQDGTGGRAVTWPAAVSWIGGSPPILLSGAGQTTLVYFYFDGTTYWGSLASGASPASIIPWTAVAAGTALAASLAKPNLAADSSGAQSTITLPTAAQMAAADGFEFTIKATGAMLSPVIVTAGAGATLELLNAPGTFGASTWLPIQGQAVVFKYDKATTTWKARASSEGSGAAGTSAYNPGWYATGTIFVDPQNAAGTSNDSNSGVASGTALRNYSEALRRWGGVAPLTGALVIVFLSSHTDNSDPVILLPGASAQVSLRGTAPTVVTAGVILGGVTSKSRAAGTNTELIATLGATAAVGQIVQNTTAGKSSRALVKRALGGNSFELTQPFVPMTAGSSSFPTEVDTWANGDTVNLLSPIAVNLVMVGASGVALAASILNLYQLAIFDPSGSGSDVVEFDQYVLCQEVIINRELVVNAGPTSCALFSVLKLQGATYNGGTVLLIGGGADGGGVETAGACSLIIDGDYCSDVAFTLSNGTSARVGFMYNGAGITLANGSTLNAQTFVYGGHIMYGRAAQTYSHTGFSRTAMVSGTWVAGFTFATAIAGGIFLNGAQTAQTHTNATPDVVTSAVATTVANADAATGGAMWQWAGSGISKGA